MRNVVDTLPLMSDWSFDGQVEGDSVVPNRSAFLEVNCCFQHLRDSCGIVQSLS